MIDIGVYGSALRDLERIEARFPDGVAADVRLLAERTGRRVSQFIMSSGAPRRLSDSFIAPTLETQGSTPGFILGVKAPRWAGLHEFGGTLRARARPYLVFEYPHGSGDWHSVKEVKIRGKHFARDAIAAVSHEAADIMGTEIARIMDT